MFVDLLIFWLATGAYLAWVFSRAPQREDFIDQRDERIIL